MPGRTPNPLTSHDNAGIASWNFKMLEDIHDYKTAREVFERLYMETTPATMTTDRVKALPTPEGFGTHYGYKIGPHMWVANEGDHYMVVLYDTPIIRYYPDGTFSVDNGGFNTSTTRDRLNAILPEGLSAYHHQKKLGLRGPGTGFDKSGLWPLDHGTRIDPSTRPPTKITTTEVER